MTDNREGVSGEAKARLVHMPHYRHSALGRTFGEATSGIPSDPFASAKLVTDECAKVAGGDMTLPSDLLAAQALTLDAVFGEMLKRAGANMGDYPEAAERYMRMAMKAQAQSRATIEALGKMHQPREQVVRHVHVYEGGQAVVAEQLHMHGPGAQNAGSVEQPYEQRTRGATLPSPDPLGNGVPVSGDAERALSHPRGKVARRPAG